ncbi:MAG TPA: hypothetical protein DCQ29_11020 [Chitinophagaceae bacterium]|nr:hypothetical protein [Chitinophagaceae bacterium]
MVSLSVIICCYNSESRIERVLEHLARQVTDASLLWEIILVDNNSTDNTVKVAEAYWKERNSGIKLYTCFESTPGLSFARNKGITESEGEYIIFCDDDNLLSSNYVQSMFNLLDKNKSIGIAGAIAEPLYETEPPLWFKENQSLFALGSLSTNSTNITVKPGWVWGAGMIIRRIVVEKIKATGFKQFLTDRVGSKMTTGGDVELCKATSVLGYEIWFNTECYFYHIMDRRRFNLEKFLDLVYENAKNSSYLRLFRVNGITRYVLTKRILLGFFKIPVLIALKYSTGIHIDYKKLQKLKWSLGSVTGNILVLFHFKDLKTNINRLNLKN